MDAVIQVEVAQLRTVVTESIVVLSVGTNNTLVISAWVTVFQSINKFLKNSIQTNAPNDKYIYL